MSFAESHGVCASSMGSLLQKLASLLLRAACADPFITRDWCTLIGEGDHLHKFNKDEHICSSAELS